MILVGAPCYRDGEELLATLRELYRQAANPDSVHVFVCYQGLFPASFPQENTEAARLCPEGFAGTQERELAAERDLLELVSGSSDETVVKAEPSIGDAKSASVAGDEHATANSPEFSSWVENNVALERIHWSEARGPCTARRRVQDSILAFCDENSIDLDGGDYYLQIDCHMRFCARWDEILVDDLAACPSDKALLTAYPGDFAPKGTAHNDLPTVLCAREFDDSGMLRFGGKVMSRPRQRPFSVRYCVAGFLFASASILADCLYDGLLEMLFFGEEALLGARLYTHGWDFFGPGRMRAWHQWSRSGRPTFWNDLRALRGDRWFDEKRDNSLGRVLRALRFVSSHPPADGEFEDAGWFGTVRTLPSYCAYAGVDFVSQEISAEALRGFCEAGGLQSDLLAMLAQFQNDDAAGE